MVYFVISKICQVLGQVVVVRACILRYLGAQEYEDCFLRPAQAKKLVRPHLNK
jgi:hypothetical protein